ncbi:hypothetical protein BN439_0309 [Erwinia amylovora Ea644]|nr:hypothetical protein BN439_0309 [Erwinia amylovora Ea644]CCP05394.1 hypothetical protein BN440_0339 [Erwinia amylovora MR1]
MIFRQVYSNRWTSDGSKIPALMHRLIVGYL